MSSNSSKRGRRFFLLLVLLLGMLPLRSQALMTDTIGILPAYPNNDIQYSNAWFIYHLDRGESKLDAVRLTNNKDETVVLKIYPVDATATTDGGFALQPEDALRNDVGGWVKMPLEEIEVPPKTEKLVPFTITIPKDANVGDHAGGIIIQEVETSDNGAPMTGMRIVSRVGVRIYETVPGEVKKGFEITRFDWQESPSGLASYFKDLLDINKKTVFYIGIKNTGNIKLDPKAAIEVRNMLGMKTAELTDQTLGVVFPGGENDGSAVFWDGQPFFGRYTVKATVTFAEDGVGQDTKEIAIWVFPWRIIFLLVILAVLLTLVRLIMLYFREAGKEKMPIYRVRMGDNLADLGIRFMAPWRKIAKLNFIGEPFDIKEGEKLFIPVSKKNKELIQRMKEQGELLPSILERSNSGSRFKKKRTFIIIVIIVLAGVSAAWGIKLRRDRVIHEQVPMPPTSQTPPTETSEKTKAGAFKKSSVNVVIVSSANDIKSGDELFRKFRLMGYDVKVDNTLPGQGYVKTTIAYASGKQSQAEMVQNDLGIKDVDLKEVSGLGGDVVIYDLAPAGDLFDLENAAAKLPNFQ